MVFVLGLLVIAATAVAILRGVDLRLALIAAAICLAILAGCGDGIAALRGGANASEALAASSAPLLRVMRTFLATFSDEKFVVPICLAMAFAYVLRETRCDEHLVQLLIRPFSHARGLFLPGVILTGFAANIPLISQGATAGAVGAVLLPLGRALGIAPRIVGAALLLGCSIGGELLNPGAPELRSVVEGVREIRPNTQAAESVAKIRRLMPWHLLTAGAVFLLLNRPGKPTGPITRQEAFRINPAKAVIPFIPLLILGAVAPPLQLWHVPQEWLLVEPGSAAEAKLFDGRLIGATMLIGTILAALTQPSAIQSVTKAFFEGAGFAFVFIMGMIVGANCFGEGVRSIGLAAVLGHLTSSAPSLLLPLAAILPMIFGTVSGSGVAATQSLFQLFVGPSQHHGLDPLETGAVVSMGAAAGRTISPVSPVNLMSAKLTEVNPLELSAKVWLPLVAGMLVTVLIAMFR